MASNNKRREATRRQLEQQLQERQRRAAARKQTVLISSIVGTVVVIAVVLVLVFTLGGSSDKNNPKAGGSSPTPTATTPTAPTTSAAPSTSTPPTDTPCKVTHPKGGAVFDDVTVANPTNLTKSPVVTSCSKTVPKTIEYKDLVVGKGAAANPKSTVSVQYFGVFYSDGYQFNSSWRDNAGKPASFPLTGVVPGFTQGIGGTAKIPPMKVGGRRIVILPSALAYGAKGNQGIPPNTPLVFVIDLKSTK